MHPVVLADGTAVGTWSSERSGDRMSLTVRPFGPLEHTHRRRIDEEGRDIGRFLGTETEIFYPKRSAR